MIEISEQMVKAFANAKNSSNALTFNNHNYIEYEELFYSIKNENNEYSASVYGIPKICTEKHADINSCQSLIKEKIDRYIFEHKIQLLNFPRPIPDGIDLSSVAIKASCKYELRIKTTISLRNAFRKINEETLKILNNNYGKFTLDEIDNVLAIEHVYAYKHGNIIKKLISGLNLYEYGSERQINISNIFTNCQNQSDLFCIYIPNDNILNIEFESEHHDIEHYPCLKSNTYKFIFKPSSSLETFHFPIKIKTKTNSTKRTYLTILKINADTYSYNFKGSENFNTDNNTIHLCAKKNFTDKLSSIFPESISEFQPQHFELFIFEFSKFLQYAIFTNYADHELHEYIKSNRPIPQHCYNLLILEDDLDSDLYNQQHPVSPFIDTVLKSLNVIDATKSVSEYDFSILKEALQKSDELNLDEQTIIKCTIYCWRYIHSLQKYDIYSKIVLLKIEEKLSDEKILDALCEIYNFSIIRKALHIREKISSQIANKSNIINSRYSKIYKIADEFKLPHPPVQRKKNKPKDKR